MAAFSSSIAIVATMSETLQNFPKRAGNLYIVLMIMYFLLCYSFEESLRNGILRGIPTEYYYPFLGIGIAAIYTISCVLSKFVEVEELYHRINSSEDMIGMLCLLLLAAIMIVVNYVCYLINYQYMVYFIIFTSVLLLNFVAAYFIIRISQSNVDKLLFNHRNDSAKYLDESNEDEDVLATKTLSEAIGDYRLYGVLIGTFIVIGTSSTFFKNIGIMKSESRTLSPTGTYSSLFLLSQAVASLVCGLL
mmetsp:Transcript_31464/g.27824  ORF Transcript_31464/g.27824 Transcript_31464/m.27824 type:complete len:248 (+) Transcript_31464:379-1122(+)